MRNTLGRHSGNNDDGWDRRERRSPGRSRRRRRRGRAFTLLAAAFAIIIGLGVTGWYVLNTSGGCSGQDIELSVAASPEITPALQEVAAEFNTGNEGVDGRCVQAEVRAAESANITYGITGAGPASGDTESDVWIPDSSMWANLVKNDSGDNAFTDTGTSVASSPLVLARPAEADMPDERPSWEALVPTSASELGAEDDEVHLVDPVRSSAGMATLALVAGAIGEEDEEGRPQLVAALQALQRNVSTDRAAAFKNLAEEPEASRLLVLSEQAAWQYNREHSDAPAQINYPEGGTYALDYPYIDRSSDPQVSQAAELFREKLTRSAAQKAMRTSGFRTADGEADAQVLTEDAGFQKSLPDQLPTPSTRDIQRLTQAWNRLKLDSRLLTIVDVSGSMLESVPGTGMNRMDITAQAAVQGLDLFPEGSELGMWRFSVGINDDLDYEEVMPIRELTAEVDGGATQLEALKNEWSSIEPVPSGDTGLYDTYLAAYREMSRTYKSDRVNAILMLTDGNNDDPDSISLDELATKLEEESSPVKPIPIFTIAFGPDIDPEPLNRIAEISGGASYTTENPAEIGDIFLKAFSNRLEPVGGQEG
ncbi:substrate-binding and VWA domain-containing protein [Streptomonospora algeriensis]|uniref:Substrate-binding and VWA domain-containing protein n=1 Tax=Streptomonospora algeriensis TaxID=995084 RepID=A0ABW3BD27_9ACTN